LVSLSAVATTARAAAGAASEEIFFLRHFEFLKIQNYVHRHFDAPPFLQILMPSVLTPSHCCLTNVAIGICMLGILPSKLPKNEDQLRSPASRGESDGIVRLLFTTLRITAVDF
jgi:hypothetical protein